MSPKKNADVYERIIFFKEHPPKKYWLFEFLDGTQTAPLDYFFLAVLAGKSSFYLCHRNIFINNTCHNISRWLNFLFLLEIYLLFFLILKVIYALWGQEVGGPQILYEHFISHKTISSHNAPLPHHGSRVEYALQPYAFQYIPKGDKYAYLSVQFVIPKMDNTGL